MAFICNTSAQFILRYTAYGVSSTYAELMAESFGSVGSTALQLCVMFSNFGGLVMSLMIIGEQFFICIFNTCVYIHSLHRLPDLAEYLNIYTHISINWINDHGFDEHGT